ncbi:hypothetical protein AB0L75_35200 [Streptomyces sp. NPDC052101]|uniref:hypothetical protein n=1 Tax=Streptomyces sp. NPDC052101 TaxID=3155763 RepID=UPI003431DCFD
MLFALTMLAAGAGRAAWRRRNKRRDRALTVQAQQAPAQPSLSETPPAYEQETSSDGRQKVSS